MGTIHHGILPYVQDISLYSIHGLSTQIITWIIHSIPSVGIGATQCKLQHYTCLTTTVGRHGG